MAHVFISYSSKDKYIAEQLASDLRSYNHCVWLDAWQIKVGQCIVREIEHGIETADFVRKISVQKTVTPHKNNKIGRNDVNEFLLRTS